MDKNLLTPLQISLISSLENLLSLINEKKLPHFEKAHPNFLLHDEFRKRTKIFSIYIELIVQNQELFFDFYNENFIQQMPNNLNPSFTHEVQQSSLIG